MIAALLTLLAGMGLATYVQFEGEMSSDEFKLTTMGILLLCLSAFIQSLEIIIENRLFQIDPSMSAFYLQGAVACWKMVFTLAVLPFCSMIHVPEEYVTGGRFESIGPALETLFANQTLVWLFVIMMVANGTHAVAGMSIIKEESAMQRQTVMMLVVPTVWIFFMVHDGKAHEEFSWKTLIGMLIVVVGSFWYIKADRDKEEQGAKRDINDRLGEFLGHDE